MCGLFHFSRKQGITMYILLKQWNKTSNEKIIIKRAPKQVPVIV